VTLIFPQRRPYTIVKSALIFGISGQDGAYLANLLLAKGYLVHGTARNVDASSLQNLARLGILTRVHTASVDVSDFSGVARALERVRPDEVYNLAGQSSVGLSFSRPLETFESIGMGTLNVLEAIRLSGRPIRLFNAGSGECFGDSGGRAADERTPFHPASPYATAKAAAFWQVSNYRDSYHLFACTGILFNHESPLRSERFVTRKIVIAACRIAAGRLGPLRLGNLGVERDWGFAGDYVEAMWLMLQQPEPDDFVLATGRSYKLRDFVREAFSHVGLDWREHVEIDPALFRPSDVEIMRADPGKALRVLGWRARHAADAVARLMVDAERGGTPEPGNVTLAPP